MEKLICILKFRAIFFVASNPWDADYLFLNINVDPFN